MRHFAVQLSNPLSLVMTMLSLSAARRMPSVEVPADVGSDPLLQLQLRVARRADEVARESASAPGLEWMAWIQAEREVFTGLEL